MKTTFPNIYKALGADETRPAFSYAIIEDGKIIATNDKVLIFSDFSNYVTNPELSENRIFDRDLLKWMAGKDFYQLECTQSGIIGYSTKGMEEKPYSGYFEIKEITKDDGESFNIRPVFLNEGQSEIGNYPDWKSIIPCDEDIEVKEVIRIGFDMNYLKLIADSFTYDSKEIRLKFEFYEKDKGVRVSPFCDFYGGQQAILMLDYIE